MIVAHGKPSIHGQASTPRSYALDPHALREWLTEELFGYGRMSAREVEQALFESICAVGRLGREGRLREYQVELVLEVLTEAYVRTKLLGVVGRFKPSLFGGGGWPAPPYSE